MHDWERVAGLRDLEDQAMADFLKVAKRDELSAGQARQVEVRGKRLALFNIDGKFYALEDTCTHKGWAVVCTHERR
jgi:nitrite reductase/ring-hydroxylating ferredoxin subunit